MRSTPPQPLTASYAASLLGLLFLAAMFAAPGLADPLYSDAIHVYVPLARRLLQEGLGLFSDPESLAVAPLAYVYPALLGANEGVIRRMNIALFCAAILLVFQAVRLTHSNPAGLLAAAFLAVSPTLPPYIANVLTEPPFLFLLAAWMAALASVIHGRLLAGAIATGLALGLAILTRPAAVYLPAVLAALFAWWAWRGRGSDRKIDLALAGAHVLAVVLVGLWIARNAVLFGYPAVATGAGNALFGGVNAMVDGFDPSYYGLSYDDGSITGPVSHLSIQGDRMLRKSALDQIAVTPWPVLAQMALRKAVAFVFVTSAENHPVPLRIWRTTMVILGVAALAWQWRSRFVMALTICAAYFITIHMPVLYHHRYSVALDLPLAALAALGIVEAFRSVARVAALVAALVFGVAFAVILLPQAGPRSPHLEHASLDSVWTLPRVATRIVPHGEALEIPITGAPKFHPWNHYLMVMEIALVAARRGEHCNALRLHYKGLKDADYQAWRTTRIPLAADGVRRRIPVGMAYPLGLNQEGILRIELECSGDAVLELGPLEIAAPRRATLQRLSEHKNAS